MNKGFTLIELLVSVSVTAIIVAVGGDIFLSVIRSYNKSNITNEVEQNGSYALTLMEREIRNASRIVSPVSSGTQSFITLEDPLNNRTEYFFAAGSGAGDTCLNGSVQKRLADATEQVLTNTSRIEGINVTALSFSVTRNDPAPPSVTINLAINQGCGASSRIDYQSSINLTTTVSLRNY